jgi:hypothetical protein
MTSKGDNMKVIRLASLMLMAVLVVGLMAASAASAATSYLFSSSSVGSIALGLSLAGTLKAGEKDLIVCAHDKSEAKIANVHLLGPFDITFSGCKSSSNGGETYCTLKSTNVATEGVILTLTVHALLGTVLPSELAGLLVLPTAGVRWFTFARNACTIESAVAGSIAGLLFASQIGHSVSESLVSFIPNDITEIDTLNGVVEPELTAFGGVPVTPQTLEHIAWDGSCEVT